MTHARQQILDCACDLCITEGVAAFSMRKLARMVGVTAPAIYRHFESREELILAVVSEGYDVLARYLHRALAEPTPVDRMRRAGMAYLDFGLEHPRYYQMLYSHPQILGLDALPEETAARCAAIGQFWNDRVRECMEEGILRRGHPDSISLVLWTQAHGLLSLYLRGLLEMEEDEFRRAYVQTFRRIFIGLATSEAAEGIRKEMELEGGAVRSGDGDARENGQEVNAVHPSETTSGRSS